MNYKFGDENAMPDWSHKIVAAAMIVGIVFMWIVFYTVYKLKGEAVFLYIIPVFTLAQLAGLGYILSTRQLN